jgi:hypothetical protein
MVIRISWLRTKVKERIRPVVHYKLRFRQPGGSEKKKAKNRQRFAKLFPNTFHCRVSATHPTMTYDSMNYCCQDLETDHEQYQSTAFISSICEAFFWAPDSPIVRHHKDFKSMPLEAAAFVLTMVSLSFTSKPNLTTLPDRCKPALRSGIPGHLRLRTCMPRHRNLYLMLTYGGYWSMRVKLPAGCVNFGKRGSPSGCKCFSHRVVT